MLQEYPPRLNNKFYLTGGGTETELLYKWGFELPEFAMFTLLDNEKASECISNIYRRYFEVAAKNNTGLVIEGHDYRASPDWAQKLGISQANLVEIQHRIIQFLSDLKTEFQGKVSDVVITGCLGPRGDAYGTGGKITEAEAEDYHSVQLSTIKETDADMAVALTFNNIPEAVGIIRAAKKIGIPIGLSLTLNNQSRLNSGPSLREAIETIDERTDGAAAWFGTNCSHPLEFEPAISDKGDWTQRLRMIRPNAAAMDKMSLCKLGHLEDGDPIELGAQMGNVASRFRSVDIIGGCCGTDERHLDAIAKNVNSILRAK